MDDVFFFFFFQAEDGIRDYKVTGVQTCALPIFTFTATASGAPTAVGVSVANNSFSPATANVKVGGTVTWTWNSGPTGHNVTYSSGPGTLPANSPTQAGGTTFSTTFTTVGTYAYHCTIHLGMEGTVKVLH